jgi:tripartite-type tricarboxylate transporter receptor subunit TctC
MGKTLATWFCGLALAAGAASAATPYPAKPIKVIVPFPAGAVTDLTARLLFEQAGKMLKQTFLIENRGGAGSRLGNDAVRLAEPDGYTLLFTNSSFGSLPIVDPTVKFNPVTDFAPVAMTAQYGLMLAINPSLPVRSLQELIEHAKANPGKLNYGSAGVGSGSHFTGEYLKQLTGVSITHVPYRSTSQALNDLGRGELSLAFDSTVDALAESRRIRLLATTHAERDPRYPDVPTIAEAGLPQMTRPSWNGVLAPAGTPPEVVQILNRTLNQVLADPAVKERLHRMGLLPAGGAPRALSAQLTQDTTFFRDAAKAANLKFN